MDRRPCNDCRLAEDPELGLEQWLGNAVGLQGQETANLPKGSAARCSEADEPSGRLLHEEKGGPAVRWEGPAKEASPTASRGWFVLRRAATRCRLMTTTLPRHAASFLDTRFHALLRQLAKQSRKASRPPPVPRRPPSAVAGHAGARGKKGSPPDPPRPRPQGQGTITVDEAGRLLGEEGLTLVRKLRTLQRKRAEFEPAWFDMKTKKYLRDVGQRCVPAVRGWGRRWQPV